MATVTFEKAQRWYPGADVPAVPGISLEIGDGEFMVLVGPSGCGKSTTLRMLAGLEEINSGKIFIGDRDITHLPPKDRDIAMVFQNYALYPHMSVADNMAFALKMAKVPEAERAKRVADAAAILGLTDYLDRKPKALSGGQRQRVAMGRAIVREPAAFLMDEPLSNLDAKLRVAMRAELSRLHTRLGVTTVYVTHDQVEAMTLGDRIVVLADGRIQQIGRPIDLYRAPVNRFVAGFIGTPPMNFVEGGLREENGQLSFIAAGVSIKLRRDNAGKAKNGEPLTLGVRPEDLRLDSSADRAAGAAPAGDALPGRVVLVERLGGTSHIHFDVEGGGSRLMASVSNDQLPDVGDTIRVRVPPERVHLFGSDGKAISNST